MYYEVIEGLTKWLRSWHAKRAVLLSRWFDIFPILKYCTWLRKIPTGTHSQIKKIQIEFKFPFYKHIWRSTALPAGTIKTWLCTRKGIVVVTFFTPLPLGIPPLHDKHHELYFLTDHIPYSFRQNLIRNIYYIVQLRQKLNYRNKDSFHFISGHY